MYWKDPPRANRDAEPRSGSFQYMNTENEVNIRTQRRVEFGSLNFKLDAMKYSFYRVTDEVLIAETAVWPNFFLMNVFFALKGF